MPETIAIMYIGTKCTDGNRGYSYLVRVYDLKLARAVLSIGTKCTDGNRGYT
jgi:hypothetical protein